MKKLLTIALLFPVLLFAQKKSGDITKFLYVKISPTLLVQAQQTERMLSEQELTPAIFGAVGAKIRYAALGISTGYFHLSQAGSINPFGADLTITDFKAKKIFPVFTAQWHKVHFDEIYVLGGGGGYGVYSTDIKGKDMFSAAVGVALPAFKTEKIFITLGFSRMNGKTTIDHSNGPYGHSYSYLKDHMDMLVVAASLAL